MPKRKGQKGCLRWCKTTGKRGWKPRWGSPKVASEDVPESFLEERENPTFGIAYKFSDNSTHIVALEVDLESEDSS